MFNPMRQVIDLNTAHGGACLPATPCMFPFTNKNVFDVSPPGPGGGLGFGWLLLTVGDVFVPHSCLKPLFHTPMVPISACSTKVFISSAPVALASPVHLLNCGDFVVPTIPSRIFIGS